jgi:predicted dehydrogenase
MFTEKPVAVDPSGVRKILAAYEDAKKKNLAIVAGTQRRHQAGYLATIQRVHDGAIGSIVAARCSWNQGSLWAKPRDPHWGDLEWQIRNWLYFHWLSGDHICEQHIHNLDVVNWALGAHPIRAVGMGGRQVRTGPEYGHIFDHFAVHYEYENGCHLTSMCRQINGCENDVSEALQGTKGSCQVNTYTVKGMKVLSKEADNEPYVQEHADLIASIRSGKPLNELKNVAESTLTAIMGRMTAYTGKAVTWEQTLASQENLMPEKLAWDMTLPVASVAIPGKTPLT